MNVRRLSPWIGPSGAAARGALAAALLLLAAACSAPAPEERLAEGDDASRPPATGETAPPGAPPAPPPPVPPPAEAGTGSEVSLDTPGGLVTCTQIGCSDGIAVELDGFSEEVELELAAGGETRTVTCLPPGPCRHFVPDFTPEEVTATAFLPDREEERTFTPEYRDERPNGPDCPPVCRQARIRWKL